MLGVHGQPVLRAVEARLGVPAHPAPVLLGRALEQRHGVRAHGLHRRKRHVDRMRVIIESLGPDVLVVSNDQRLGFREQITQPHVGVRFAVGAVHHDFVRGPAIGPGLPFERLARDFGERGAEKRRPAGVALDQLGTLGGGERHVRVSGRRYSIRSVPLAQFRARPATKRAVAPGRTRTPSRESNRIAPTSESPTPAAPMPANGPSGGAGSGGDPGNGVPLSVARRRALAESAAFMARPTALAPGMLDLARIESRCRSVRVSRAAAPPPLAPPEQAAVSIRTTAGRRVMVCSFAWRLATWRRRLEPATSGAQGMQRRNETFMPERTRQFLSSRWGSVVCGVITAVVTWCAWGSLNQIAAYHDEAAYLLQAGIFASGRWTAAARPLPEFFEQYHVLVTPVLASKYWPGHSLLMVPGVWLGLPGLVPVLLSGLAGALCFALARRVAASPWVALVTWLFWTSAPGGLYWRGARFSEITTSALWLVGWW